MDLCTTFLAASLTATANEYLIAKLGWTFDIRGEILCWVIVWLVGNYMQRQSEKVTESTSSRSKSILDDNSLTWLASLCMALERVIPIYYDVSPFMPLTIVFTFLATTLQDTCTIILPSAAGWSDQTAKRPPPRQSQIFLSILLVLGFILLPHASPILPSIVFVMARCSAFWLIQTLSDNDHHRCDIPRTLQSIAARVCCIIVAFTVIIPPSSPMTWHLILQSPCTAATMACILYLGLRSHALAASTIDSYSVAVVQSLASQIPPDFLALSLHYVSSLAFGISSLPQSSKPNRLFALLIVPILLLLGGKEWPLEWRPFQLSSNTNLSIHPIQQLATEAETGFRAMLSQQSKSLEAACAEYKRRYNRLPPPNFEKWFQAAQSKQFLLIDEFDTMMATMEPLWGVSPIDLRARVQNALSEGRGNIAPLQIQKDQSPSPDHWMTRELASWITGVHSTLPDMQLAINVMDEPKVIVPHDILSHDFNNAHRQSNKPILPGKNRDLSQSVNFLDLGSQNIWDTASISCPSDSPARDFEQSANRSAEWTDLGFLSNLTLSKDICQFPDLRNIYGTLLLPASMAITHSMVPIFSQAKLSCFHDILYPSPYYALRLGDYDPKDDMEWEDKKDIVYWVGSNTGGRSSLKTWRSFQRQRLTLMTMNETQPVNLLDQQESRWVLVNSTMKDIIPYTDVRISAAIQCDDDACAEQEDIFNIKGKERGKHRDGYSAKYNLDLDGNGFSGRFYRLLMSKSAVLKQTLQKEWHDDWLVPWLHYIPVSMDLEDFPEIVRYLTQEPDGRALGKKVAESSQEWAGRVLRKEDMKLVFWRLLLEYGRILSDDREEAHGNCTFS